MVRPSYFLATLAALGVSLSLARAQYAYTVAQVGSSNLYGVVNAYVDNSGDLAVSEYGPSGLNSVVSYGGTTQTLSGIRVDGITNTGVVLAGQGTATELLDHGTVTSLNLASADFASAISTNGQYIAGVVSGGAGQVALFGQNGAVTLLGAPTGTYSSLAVTGVNNSGAIVGSYYDTNYNLIGFEYSNSTFTTLAGTSGNGASFTDINNLGTVTGEYSNNRYMTNAGFTDANGTVTNLTGLGGSQYAAMGINDSGTIVGFSQTSAGANSAVTFQNGAAVSLASQVNLAGTNFSSLNFAYGVSNTGYIVGMGALSAGGNAIFELTPTNLGGGLSVVPEPMTYFLWTILGLAGLAIWRLRQRAQAAV